MTIHSPELSQQASLQLSALSLSDGTVINAPANGTLLFVGPNNTGKSLCLREIRQHFYGFDQNTKPKIVTAVTFNKVGDLDSARRFAEMRGAVVEQGGQLMLHTGQGSGQLQGMLMGWNNSGSGALTPLFLLYADAETRLTAASPVQNIDVTTQPVSSPLQRLYLRPDLETQLQELSTRAFGSSVVVDRYAGSMLHLRVGQPPRTSENLTTEYINEIHSLPSVETVGDGVRAFLGLALHMIAGNHCVTVIDEPEAFLHPPQASLLGQILSRERTAIGQVVLATHSSDIVRGVLAGQNSTTVVRLTRDGNITKACVLGSIDLQALWQDPLLRYSNLLDSLFHEQTVLCEGDADCRFYSSILDELRADAVPGAFVRDVLFAHCGGKQRMPMVIKAVRAIGIPLKVVADFDVQRHESDIRAIYEALGGEWSDIQTQLTIIRAALDTRLEAPLLPEVRRRVEEILSGAGGSGDRLSPGQSDAVREATRTATGWDSAKTSGFRILSQGDASKAWRTLDEHTRRLGLFIVPVGELERFVPDIPGHGPSWVTEVHRVGAHQVAATGEAGDFIKAMLRAATPDDAE